MLKKNPIQSVQLFLFIMLSFFLCFPPMLLGEDAKSDGIMLDGHYIGTEENRPMEPVAESWVRVDERLRQLSLINGRHLLPKNGCRRLWDAS